MESENNKIINDFITDEEVKEILLWVNEIDHIPNTNHHHIVEVRKDLKGYSHMYDISKTKLTQMVTKKQSGDDVVQNELPEIFYEILNKISKKIEIPTNNCYLQILDMNKGGKIRAHYDVAINGYISYKCNISVLSESYELNVDKHVFRINPKDLYCFEASLYKHWTEHEFNSRRVLLSYGFILPYSFMGRDERDPRVRLSKRIQKYFQN